MTAALILALLPGILWKHDGPAPGPAARVYRNAAEVTGYVKVPAPRADPKTDRASATAVPWIDANGWRFQRGLQKALYAELPAGTSARAAAEAFAYGVDAVVEPPAQDAAALAKMLEFLARMDAPAMPPLANIGIVDDRSEEIDEVLNLLGRRNLLYRVVRAPDPKLGINVRLGSREFPRESAADPNDFAARIREKLGDERRLVRLYGSYVVLAHLTGDSKRARLHLINYASRPVKDLRIRVRGPYTSIRLAGETGKEQAIDEARESGVIEVTVPEMQVYTIVDLESN